MTLLRGLGPEQWNAQTVAPLWRVRDVAAHLLDGDLRRLSFQRDRLVPPPRPRPIDSYASLVEFLNQLNAEWVRASQRISPRLLVDLLAFTGREATSMFESSDLDAPALFAVDWAGERESRLWMDLAREFTERWHHQMQIRDAVGAAPLFESRLLCPMLDTSMRAVPFRYRHIAAPAGTTLQIAVEGAGTPWSIVRSLTGWDLFEGTAGAPHAAIEVESDVAWRVFFKAIAADAAIARSRISGDRTIALPFFTALAVMA